MISAQPVTDAEIGEAYKSALAYGGWRARGKPQEYGEALRDAATDAVVWARDNYDPARGEFGGFCHKAAETAVGRAVVRLAEEYHNRPEFGGLSEDMPARELPAAGEVPITADLADLPDDEREAVLLVMLNGYTHRQAADVAGCGEETIRRRLIRAARKLAPDGVSAPIRPPGTKRIRGG